MIACNRRWSRRKVASNTSGYPSWWEYTAASLAKELGQNDGGSRSDFERPCCCRTACWLITSRVWRIPKPVP